MKDYLDKFTDSILEHIKEVSYARGSSVDGAATFRGGPYGFGGRNQLAQEPIDAVKKLKKHRDAAAVYNIEDQAKINRGYPAPQSVSGFPGGESNSGIRSGARIPNKIPRIALSPNELEKQPSDQNQNEEEYEENNLNDNSSLKNILNDPNMAVDEETYDEEAEEYYERGVWEHTAMGAGHGGHGAGRALPSDSSYGGTPGFPRHNALAAKDDFVPEIENDVDGDGEEDDYLTDEEYVDDIFQLNAFDSDPILKKQILNKESADLTERTLYHGTVNDHIDSIKKFGLLSDVGDFVKDSYGLELDEDDWENKLDGVIFATDKSELDKAVGAMRYHIGKKLDKHLTDVTIDDLRAHGMLVIIREIEDDEESKDFSAEDKWIQYSSREEEGGGEAPMSVEPRDWYYKSETGTLIDDVLTGKKMIQFLRRENGLKDTEEDMRRNLIKMAIKHHGTEQRNNIIKKVKNLPSHELRGMIHTYKKLTENKRKSLKNIFRETYVSPGPNPEPNRGVERYKQGNWLSTADAQADPTKYLMKHVDHTGGHASMEPAEESPGGMTYGQVVAPKNFIPKDWEQRNDKTEVYVPETYVEEKNMNKNEIAYLKEVIRKLVKEAFTGLEDDTKEPKGGSAAFKKSREKVFKYDEKQKPKGVKKDLKNYHMEKDEKE